MAKAPKTSKYLCEKLDSQTHKPLSKLMAIFAVSIGVGFLSGAMLTDPKLGFIAAGVCFAVLMLLIVNQGKKDHFLIRFDHQGIMANLKLSQKTAIFDGSNIYHFGLDKKLGPLPLGALVSALRSEGYRIVCFFDANIYFTLRKNREFRKRYKHFSVRILQNIFELKPNEIYVVPTGVKADEFIVESLSHLPISFAVTNDQFREYAESYELLANNNKWRKGVRLQKGELLLYQHKFKYPLVVK